MEPVRRALASTPGSGVAPVRLILLHSCILAPVQDSSKRDTGAMSQAEAGLRARKKQQTRQALIEAALRLYREKGLDGVTVAAILSRAWWPQPLPVQSVSPLQPPWSSPNGADKSRSGPSSCCRRASRVTEQRVRCPGRTDWRRAKAHIRPLPSGNRPAP